MLGMDSGGFTALTRGMRRGLRALRRERGWGQVMGALAATLAVLQLMAVAGVGLQAAGANLRGPTGVRLLVRTNAKDSDIQTLFAAVRQLPAVSNVVYVTKEQSYEQQRKSNPQVIAAIEAANLRNPFPDVLSVTLRSAGDLPGFTEFVRSSAWSGVVDPTFQIQVKDLQQEIAFGMILVQGAQQAGGILLVLLLCALLFTLASFLSGRVRNRLEEIVIERLAGAHPFVILVPFATEAAALLLGALLFGGILAWVALLLLTPLLPALPASGTAAGVVGTFFALLPADLPWILGGEIVAIPFLAFAAAWVAIRRNNRVTE
jgi:cell division protein FtsX